MALQARKRFGQHFLQDQGVIQDILHAIQPRPGEQLVEIGPGLGALTVPLLARVPQLTVIELDRDLVAHWQRHPLAPRLTVHAADALGFDYACLGERLRLVGNLPYNISTPLLFHLAGFAAHIVDAHFMLQKEVVQRMVATAGDPAYGRLSVLLQLRFQMVLLLEVPPEAFKPAPKVDSAVVRLVPRSLAERRALFALSAQDTGPDSLPVCEQALERVVTQAFSQRRKMLRSTLKGLLGEALLRHLDIDPTRRAETLTLTEFVALAQALRQQSPPTRPGFVQG